MVDKQIIKRLRNECETMRSRIEAILKCEDAIGYLETREVFGRQYSDLLSSDVNELTEAIALADTAMETCVE